MLLLQADRISYERGVLSSGSGTRNTHLLLNLSDQMPHLY